MKYIISWDEGRVVEDTISQNYHPFNKMEVIDAKYNGNESTILPIFYKNKSIGRTIGDNEYIYYLISERPFDDFYPVESHLNQDGFYSKEIYLESDWREVQQDPLYLDTYDNKKLYDDCFFINASIWNDYLYYLYMIKTMSFFPFKQLVENYTPIYCTTSYAPLNSITQTPDFTVDGTSFTINKIKLNNASDLELTDGMCVLAGVAFSTGSSAPNIRSLPLSQTYPDYPLFTRAFVHRIPDTDDYDVVPFYPMRVTFAQNTAKPYIVFLSQIPYDYYPKGELVDDVHEYEDLDIENGTLESPVRMKVDFIKNLFPVFYNADFSTTWNRTGWTLEEHLKKTTNYNTPIFFSNNSNILYNQTSKRVNIVTGQGASDPNPNRYVTCYFVNNFMLDYKTYNLLSLDIDKSRNVILTNQTLQTNFLYLRESHTFNKSDLNYIKIVGNLEGTTATRLGATSLCFVGTDENLAGTYNSQTGTYNGNDNPATGVQGFCWNSLVCINSNAIEWLQFEDETIKIVTRRVAYSKEQ